MLESTEAPLIVSPSAPVAGISLNVTEAVLSRVETLGSDIVISEACNVL